MLHVMCVGLVGDTVFGVQVFVLGGGRLLLCPV